MRITLDKGRAMSGMVGMVGTVAGLEVAIGTATPPMRYIDDALTLSERNEI